MGRFCRRQQPKKENKINELKTCGYKFFDFSAIWRQESAWRTCMIKNKTELIPILKLTYTIFRVSFHIKSGQNNISIKSFTSFYTDIILFIILWLCLFHATNACLVENSLAVASTRARVNCREPFEKTC